MNSHHDAGMNPVFAHTTVPIDGSASAERGVAFALELARDGGLVTFCSVVDPSLVCLPAAYRVALYPAPLLTVLDDNAAEFCRQARAKAAEAGIAAEGHVLHDQCVDAIDALVRGNASQAIVVGTHGRTGFARTVLGSVAEGLVRRSDVPVVAVHENDLVRTGPIGVAFDESPAAHAALGVATAIAAARGIPVVVIHASDAANADASRVDALLAGAEKRARAARVRAGV